MCQCTQFGTLRDSRQCSQDSSRLGFASALPQLRLGYASTMPHLRLDYALASISCEHCRSSRNHPHCVPRHIIYYYNYCMCLNLAEIIYFYIFVIVVINFQNIFEYVRHFLRFRNDFRGYASIYRPVICDRYKSVIN